MQQEEQVDQKVKGIIKKDISSKIKNRKGFTLIEVIVSVAIIGIIATSVLYFFGFSMESVSMSGKRTDNILYIEEEVDTQIANYKNKGIKIVKVKIPSLTIEKEIKGDRLEKIQDNVKIQTFIPNKVKTP